MHDVLVIGGGQAGLAAGYHLQKRGLDFAILEAGAQPGGSWPAYYASLRLFSPARYSSLPGLPFPGPGERYPARDEVVAYLRAYAAHFALPVRTNARVQAVSRTATGFAVKLASGERLAARALIAATGAFQRPHLPKLPGQAAFRGNILHSAAYQDPSSFAGQRVLVVGGGNSAVQIAVELAAVAQVSLVTRQPLHFQAQRMLGRDIHWWWDKIGFGSIPLANPLGRLIQRHTAGVVLDAGAYQAAIAAGKPDHRALFDAFTPDGVRWPDGSVEAVDAVIFATGYRPGLEYLAPLGALDAEGRPLQRAGRSLVVPNLGFVGLEQQRTFASATLRGVGSDARRVVAWLVANRAPSAACCASPLAPSR